MYCQQSDLIKLWFDKKKKESKLKNLTHFFTICVFINNIQRTNETKQKQKTDLRNVRLKSIEFLFWFTFWLQLQHTTVVWTKSVREGYIRAIKKVWGRGMNGLFHLIGLKHIMCVYIWNNGDGRWPKNMFFLSFFTFRIITNK